MQNGVKRRHDGLGDAWANEHRSKLGSKALMNDIDGICGTISIKAIVEQHTENSIFIEYEPDHRKNIGSKVRNFGIVALFDRKKSTSAALSSNNTLSLSIYLHICRVFRKNQDGIAPKFFFVIGDKSPPWKLIEIDIDTGEKVGKSVVIDKWTVTWNKIGLFGIRKKLQRWIDGEEKEKHNNKKSEVITKGLLGGAKHAK
jgi:hypothetical protein